MLVSNWMSKPVITIDENDSMKDAIGLLKENNIRILPVINRGNLVGVVTDRDLKRASSSDATSLEIHELHYLTSTIKVKEITGQTGTVRKAIEDHKMGKLTGSKEADASDKCGTGGGAGMGRGMGRGIGRGGGMGRGRSR